MDYTIMGFPMALERVYSRNKLLEGETVLVTYTLLDDIRRLEEDSAFLAREQVKAKAIATVRQTLTDWGMDQLDAQPPHSWRCAYYKDIDPAKGGGPCTCVEDVVTGYARTLNY
jgi:hypothetical protein